ncbi:hypothetical protein IWT25_02213 [Secundilactobacillus pentosiphilus]|uniref:DUF2089 domain-containing protein n=1 Tax=Secundilactobacillus pentosiphilus TaxID=1714682 RepID=A0A1Z5IZ05_9LACO|nr:DUF2089 domain-containing protein [Secundilactobacillus pentosiphilus]GAX06866.1 hypothetical protein IWT25_02213 [Secundilactobacillus pentosiphilus]
MDWFLSLSPEDQEFIKQFLLASGSLKQLAKIYDVSYPTVRTRVDRLIEKIKILSQIGTNSFESKVMQMVVDEKLPLSSAKEILKSYQEEKNE